MTNKNMVTWFEIYVEDMERAKTFYETVMGIQLNEMPTSPEMGMTLMAFPWAEGAPNAAGALAKSNLNKPGGSGTIVYLESEDCNTELSRIEGAGGKILLPKTPAGEYGFFCLFSDTEGNTVGFFSKK